MDADDIQLVEMLANLAEENQDTSNVDDDSVLGSQCSVFSELAKNDPEEDEVEDLNITSLDLDLGSWESACKESSQRDDILENVHYQQNTESAKDSNATEEKNYDEDVTLTDFPQLDGVDDLHENILTYEKNNLINKIDTSKCHTAIISVKDTRYAVPVINTTNNYAVCNFYGNFRLFDIIKYFNRNNPNRQYQLREELYNFVNRCYFHIFIKAGKNLRNTSYIENLYNDQSAVKKIYFLGDERRNIVNKEARKECTYYQLQLDHQDLDVYDVHGIETSEDLDDVNRSNCIEDTRLCRHRRVGFNKNYSQKLNSSSAKFVIPSIDGATGTDSSDSELETDVTIDRKEERICSYKSDKKKATESLVQKTPRKRKLDLEDEESPGKRKNTIAKTPRRQYGSPSRVSRSPQLSGSYSPLNVVIISPKSNRSPLGRCESLREERVTISDGPSTSAATPKRKTHPLRVSLLREQRATSLLNLNLGK